MSASHLLTLSATLNKVQQQRGQDGQLWLVLSNAGRMTHHHQLMSKLRRLLVRKASRTRRRMPHRSVWYQLMLLIIIIVVLLLFTVNFIILSLGFSFVSAHFSCVYDNYNITISMTQCRHMGWLRYSVASRDDKCEALILKCWLLRQHLNVNVGKTHTLGKLSASATNQYNLVLVEGRWRSLAWKVTTGLAIVMVAYHQEVIGKVTCGLTACTLGSALGPALGSECGRSQWKFVSCLWYVLKRMFSQTIHHQLKSDRNCPSLGVPR